MLNLIRSDFRRVLRDKLTFILCIIGFGFSIFTPLLYKGIFSMSGSDPMTETLIGSINAKTIFFSSFSTGNNFGLIIPVLLAIVLCKDFSFGTVRNKIIGGHKRTNIFISMYVVCATVMIGVVLLHAFLSLFVSLLFFNYQSAPFEFSDAVYFVISLLLEVVVYLFLAALLTWMCATFKNVGIAIVLYVALSFIMTIVSTIIAVAIEIMSVSPNNDNVLDILHFVQRINLFNAAATIGNGDSYKLIDILYIIVPAFVGIAGLLGLGIKKFNKKDLK
ncbi:MAG: hypothetical protein J6Q76_04105 [Clostridia bacterium]|nr:hypothetical protein [Clostridia bacterium]